MPLRLRGSYAINPRVDHVGAMPTPCRTIRPLRAICTSVAPDCAAARRRSPRRRETTRPGKSRMPAGGVASRSHVVPVRPHGVEPACGDGLELSGHGQPIAARRPLVVLDRGLLLRKLTFPRRKRTRENRRCPARTGDLLLVRREQMLRSAAVCRSNRSASDGPHLATALCCGLLLPEHFHTLQNLGC